MTDKVALARPLKRGQSKTTQRNALLLGKNTYALKTPFTAPLAFAKSIWPA